MATLFIIYFLFMSQISSSYSSDTLNEGSSLSVERPDQVLTSLNKVFAAGFFPVGMNSYSFSIWFNEPNSDQLNRTIVWIANRDRPVNGKRSKLSLLKTGNLILTDASLITVWNTDTTSSSQTKLKLFNSGNLVLIASDGVVLWQSFDHPTDTLLQEQALAKDTKLVSSRSQGNFSSGFYRLFFDNDNLLRLAYNGFQLSSVYWPPPWLVSWEAGRSSYNNSKIAVLDSLGNFSSSDDFTFISADYGGSTQRRLKIDYDGNLRLYTRRNSSEKRWVVSWQAFSDPCKIHGHCGLNSLCSYDIVSGMVCSCIPGHKMRNSSDWSYGCEPEFKLTCLKNESNFMKLLNTEFYGYDYGFFPNYTFSACRDLCLQLCNCVGFQYSYFFAKDKVGFNCYPKVLLVNGYKTPMFFGDFYLRFPRNYSFSALPRFGLTCSNKLNSTILMPTKYFQRQENELATFILWFICGVGIFEIMCVLLVWYFLFTRSQKNSSTHTREYLLAAARFKRFSFPELKKATQNFSKEIGRGSSGIVFKGVLSDSRVAAIKRLNNEANCQGEAEFLTEVNIIGRVNHMNLIAMLGYCVEGRHRLLVYEYLEHGSLTENLSRNDYALSWKTRFEIALGTAKGLAYLHEECLEWVLHCDVKPQNILLGSDFTPKVADFGLSKLLNRSGELEDHQFSRIRGTRGYMAPEWVTNQIITSKVDVYSYGIVVLEMLTGKNSATCNDQENRSGLVKWVREKVYESSKVATWLGNIMDPLMESEYDLEKMGVLLGVALKCVEEKKDARPSMSQVVKMLQDHV
ncbi:hypothetical protein CsatA_029667 [Cannabis sativa]